jgi:hypothetical protein
VKDVTNDFSVIETGRGYLYANKYDVTVSFVGEANSESKSYNLTKTEGINLSGFHLIGNPFAHNIYKGAGAAIDDDNLVDGYYTLSNSGAWEVNISNEDPIKPCQSILVKTMKPGEVVINKTNQASSQKSDDNEMLMVKVSNKNYEDKAYVLFGENQGLEKINHQNEDVPMVHIPIDNVNYAIATLAPETKEVPLSFVAKTMGEYTININADETFEYVYLVDNVTGNVTNMLMEDYTFIATTNDIPNRFAIRLSEVSSINENKINSDVFAYVNNGNLILNNISERAQISVYDIMGRMILSDIVNDVDEAHVVEMNNVKTGIYFVKISDKKGIRVQKIIL